MALESACKRVLIYIYIYAYLSMHDHKLRARFNAKKHAHVSMDNITKWKNEALVYSAIAVFYILTLISHKTQGNI